MSGVVSTNEDVTPIAGAIRMSSDGPPNDASPTEGGARLGRYLLIERLGRGGMGEVLRAYDPKLQREVALKRVRTDALDESLQARLVREARAMAKLNHPNVVAVYDVEVDAHVVIAMEYVPGTTLRTWLKDAKRPWREVVDAFIAAGRGLSAAHAQGLLHRDFKPDNVLVGDDGRVRVTDFGLARGSNARSASETRSQDSLHGVSSDDLLNDSDGISVELTHAGMVMGTPLYMAPEQMDGAELDARIDQYALCVALWQALTGRSPFEGRGRALLRAKRTSTPRWPSDVSVPSHVVAALRRGLAAEPDMRWPSVLALLGELSRDPSRSRRRAALVGVLAIAVLGGWGAQHMQRTRALVACAAESDRIAEVWNARRADVIAEAFAATGLAYAADTWQRSRSLLDEYATQWRQARRSICERAGVERTLGPDLADASRACLQEHRDDLDALLLQLEHPDAAVIHEAAMASASLPQPHACADDTQLRQYATLPAGADERAQIGALRIQLAQARAAKATGRYAEALAVAQEVLERSSDVGWIPLRVQAQLQVASVQEKLGRYEDARALDEQAFYDAGAAARDELALQAGAHLLFVLGERLARHEEAERWGRLSQMLADRLGLSHGLSVAHLQHHLGYTRHAAGAYEDAAKLHELALANREEALGREHPVVAASLEGLAQVRQTTGAYEEAAKLQERALAIRENALGPAHPAVATSLNNLAHVHFAAGAYEASAVAQERALAIRENALGPAHPEVAASLSNLGIVRNVMGAYEQAAKLHERALAIREKVLGPEHPDVAASLNNLATLRRNTGNHAEAAKLHERALAIREKVLGPEHPDVATSLNNLAIARNETGAYEEAATLHARALEIWEKTLGPDHPDVAASLNNLAIVRRTIGSYEEAAKLHERALEILQKALGPDHPRVAHSLLNLADVRLQVGAYEEAAKLAERALAIRERALSPEHTDVAGALVLGGRIALAQRRLDDAIAFAERAVKIREAPDVPAVDLAAARLLLARVLLQDRADRARALVLAQRARDAYREAGMAYREELDEAEALLHTNAAAR